MFKTLLKAALSTFFALPAAATTQEELFQMILQGDLPTLEAALDAVDDEVKAGIRHPDRQRALYELFSTTHPETIALLERWRAEYPRSRHARAGWMWHNRHLGLIMRGERSARYTSREAFAGFYGHGGIALEMAHQLIAEEPGFLPGSDGMFRLLAMGGPRHDANGFLEDVFEVRPNTGTLDRFVDAFTPNWGGSWHFMQEACRAYAPRVLDRANYDGEICIAEAFLRHHYTLRQVSTGPLEIAGRRFNDLSLRAQAHFEIMNGDAGKAETAIDAYRAAPHSLQIARDLFNHYSQTFRIDPQNKERALERMAEEKSLLEALLRYDPYFPSLLREMVQVIENMGHYEIYEPGLAINYQIFEVVRDAGFEPDLLNEAKPEDVLPPDLAAEVSALFEKQRAFRDRYEAEVSQPKAELQTRAYRFGKTDPAIWQTRANELMRTEKLEDLPKMRDALRGAVYFSNYEPTQLQYMFYQNMNRFERITERWNDQPFSSDPAFEERAETRAFACEAAWAARHLDAICPAGKDGQRPCMAWMARWEDFEEKKEKVWSSGHCLFTFFKPMSLLYDAAPPDWPE